MNKNIIITVDIEPDYNKYIKNGFLGVKYVIPQILNILDEFDIKGEFFVTSDIILKFNNLMKKICKEHILGSHSYHHEELAYKKINFNANIKVFPKIINSLYIYKKRSYKEQFTILQNATYIFKKYLSYNPISFRAPNFSANGDTIKILEKLGYKYDSSVLHGKYNKQFNIFPVYDFRQVFTDPYYPDYNNISKKGNSKILEFPVTENLFLKRSPLGIGYLNLFGIKNTLKIIDKMNKCLYITFLIHPYELLNLKLYYPKYRNILPKYCKNNLIEFRMLINELNNNGYNFITFKDVINMI